MLLQKLLIEYTHIKKYDDFFAFTAEIIACTSQTRVFRTIAFEGLRFVPPTLCIYYQFFAVISESSIILRGAYPAALSVLYPMRVFASLSICHKVKRNTK